MKKSIRFIGTWLLTIALLISCMSPMCVQAATTKVAKTQKQLEKLLSDENAKTIQINTTKKITITIPKGSFDKKIIINAPKASVINNAKLNGITVKNLTKYTEKTKGNTLSIKDTKLTLNVSKTAEVKSLVVSNKKANVKIVADGNVKKLTVNSAKSVDIKGKHSKPINVNSNAEGVTIKANSSVNVTMNKDGNLVVNVEQVKVIAGKDDVIATITNNTEITIVIVDKNDETIGEVKSDETSDVTNDNKSDKDKTDNKDDKKDTDKTDNKDKDKDKDKDKSDNKNDTDKKDDSFNQNTDNSSSGSTGGSSGNNGSSSDNGGSIVTPPVTDNYSITVTSAPAILYVNSIGIVNYELKNNSTKLSAVPATYHINTFVSGCAVTTTSFGSIAISASAISGSAMIRIELRDKNDNIVTSKTVDFVVETPEPSFNLSELNNGYQIKFTYWNDSNNFFNTFTEHKHYAYISSTADGSTPLASTNWQVAVTNNKNQNDESLVWIDLSNTTAVSGVADNTYYQNGEKLTFNSTGKYYLRAKYNDQYVYSVPISVDNLKENNEFEDVKFGDQTYNVHIFQETQERAAFYVVDYAPEEIEGLFSGVTYIEYLNIPEALRGLWVSYDTADLSSYCIVRYTYDAEASYHLDGQITSKQYFKNCKQVKVEKYENGVLVQDTLKFYDEQGRTYVIKNRHYDENGLIYAVNGRYYTFENDEDVDGTMHYGFPDGWVEPTE